VKTSNRRALPGETGVPSGLNVAQWLKIASHPSREGAPAVIGQVASRLPAIGSQRGGDAFKR